jgi:hypothetical protein
VSAFNDLGPDGVRDLMRSISEPTTESMISQGKVFAANLIGFYGDDCFSARGFIAGVSQSFETALVWLLAEGHVTLTESAASSPEEIDRRRVDYEAAVAAANAAGRTVDERGPGSYL